jgi:hypothetical protein
VDAMDPPKKANDEARKHGELAAIRSNCLKNKIESEKDHLVKFTKGMMNIDNFFLIE